MLGPARGGGLVRLPLTSLVQLLSVPADSAKRQQIEQKQVNQVNLCWGTAGGEGLVLLVYHCHSAAAVSSRVRGETGCLYSRATTVR